MAEGSGDLGDVTWGARIRLDELDGDIAQVDRRMEELYGRWERRSMSVKLNSAGGEEGGGSGGTATRTLSGGGTGGRGELFDMAALDATQRKVDQILASVDRASRDITSMSSLADRTVGAVGETSGSSAGAATQQIATAASAERGPYGIDEFGGRGAFPVAPARSSRGRRFNPRERLGESDLVGEDEARDTLTEDDLVDEGGGGRGGRGSLLTRGFTRRFAGGLLAYEALRIGQGYVQEQQTIGLNPGNLVAELGARQKFNEALEGVPFLGQIAGLAGYAYQSLGGRGQTADAAAFGAQQGMADVAAGTQRLLQARSYANQAQDNINAGIIASDVGDLQRRRDEANQRYATTYRGIQDRDFALQQQYIDQRQTDPFAAARTKAEHDLLGKNAVSILNSADVLRNSEIAAAQRESDNLNATSSLDVATASRSYSLDVLNQPLARRRNEIQGSWERQILELRQHNASDTLISNAQSREDFELGTLNVDIARDRTRAIAGLNTETSGIGLRLGRDPYGAQIDTVNRQAAADIDYLGNDPESDPTKQAIRRRAAASVALIEQARSDSLQRLGIDQSAQLGQVNALLARDPTLAQAIGITTETTDRATDIARMGPQFRQTAINQLAIGNRRLDLERQEFLHGFRGTEFNPNRDDVTNPVDQVNIKKRLKEINDSQQQIDEFAKNFDRNTGTGSAAPKADFAGTSGAGKVTLDDAAETKMTSAFSAALREALAN